MGIIAAFKEIVADNRFWKDCARKAQAELLAAGKQLEKLQDDAINEGVRVIGMLDAAHIDAEKMMHERDAALAELSQVRAELQNMTRATRKQAAHHHRRQTKMAAERDAAGKQAEALSEENARLKAQHEEWKREDLAWRDERAALLGRAVTALQEARTYLLSGVGSTAGVFAAINAILADATATQAADAWRAQQEERAEHSDCDNDDCQKCHHVDALKIDARRGQGGE